MELVAARRVRSRRAARRSGTPVCDAGSPKGITSSRTSSAPPRRERSALRLRTSRRCTNRKCSGGRRLPRSRSPGDYARCERSPASGVSVVVLSFVSLVVIARCARARGSGWPAAAGLARRSGIGLDDGIGPERRGSLRGTIEGRNPRRAFGARRASRKRRERHDCRRGSAVLASSRRRSAGDRQGGVTRRPGAEGSNKADRRSHSRSPSFSSRACLSESPARPASRAALPQSFAKPSWPSAWNIVCRSAKSSRCT